MANSYIPDQTQIPIKEPGGNELSQMEDDMKHPVDPHAFENCANSDVNALGAFHVGYERDGTMSSTRDVFPGTNLEDVYDDGGVTGGPSSMSNTRITKFSILDNLELPLGGGHTISSTVGIYNGSLLFGYRNRACLEQPSQSVIRLTVADLNRRMYEDVYNSTVSNTDRMTIFRSPSEFCKAFYFVGSALHNDASTGVDYTTYTRDGCSNIVSNTQSIHDTRHDTLDQVVKGNASIVNIWGNSPLQIESGAFLFLILRWVPYMHIDSGQDAPPENCYSTLDIWHSDHMSQYHRYTKEKCKDPNWYMQLVPFVSMDGRYPYAYEHSPNGRGHIFYVGTVLHNTCRNKKDTEGRYWPYNNNVVYPYFPDHRSSRQREIAALDHVGVLEVAIGQGSQHSY